MVTTDLMMRVNMRTSLLIACVSHLPSVDRDPLVPFTRRMALSTGIAHYNLVGDSDRRERVHGSLLRQPHTDSGVSMTMARVMTTMMTMIMTMIMLLVVMVLHS